MCAKFGIEIYKFIPIPDFGNYKLTQLFIDPKVRVNLQTSAANSTCLPSCLPACLLACLSTYTAVRPSSAWYKAEDFSRDSYVRSH